MPATPEPRTNPRKYPHIVGGAPLPERRNGTGREGRPETRGKPRKYPYKLGGGCAPRETARRQDPDIQCPAQGPRAFKERSRDARDAPSQAKQILFFKWGCAEVAWKGHETELHLTGQGRMAFSRSTWVPLCRRRDTPQSNSGYDQTPYRRNQVLSNVQTGRFRID